MKQISVIGPITRYLLVKICDIIVGNGYHETRIKEYLEIMHEAMKKRFTEDNSESLKAYMRDLI